MLSPYSSVYTSDKHTALKYIIARALNFKIFYKLVEWVNTVEIRFLFSTSAHLLLNMICNDVECLWVPNCKPTIHVIDIHNSIKVYMWVNNDCCLNWFSKMSLNNPISIQHWNTLSQEHFFFHSTGANLLNAWVPNWFSKMLSPYSSGANLLLKLR